MPLVRARLADHRRNAAPTPAVGGGIVIGLNRNLLHAIHGGQHGQAHDPRNIALIEDRDAVHLKIIGGFLTAVELIANGAGEKVALVAVGGGGATPGVSTIRVRTLRLARGRSATDSLFTVPVSVALVGSTIWTLPVTSTV